MLKCNEWIEGHRCAGEMKHGKVMEPVWGTLDGRPVERGTTISMVDATLSTCMKCSRCGHSVVEGGMKVRTSR